MILVDSSVWIDYLRGTSTPPANKLDSLLGTVPLAIGDLILTEVLQGCLLYTSDAADDLLCVDLGGRRIIKKKNKQSTPHNIISIHTM